MAGSRRIASIILVDWSVRESFHAVDCLNNQTVPRDDYELIWVEYYNSRPGKLKRHWDKGNLDRWIVLGKKGMYFKHKMYNIGLVWSKGDIIVIPASDAMFSPTFVESILDTFEEYRDEDIVLYLDEVRNQNGSFHPVDETGATWEEIMEAPGIYHFDFKEMKPPGAMRELLTPAPVLGLPQDQTRLVKGNYGACFCATRKSAIEAGGFDEHPGYLAFWCGPYEMGWRLVNKGFREIWHSDEWTLHPQHPGTEAPQGEVSWTECEDPTEATITPFAKRKGGYNALALEILKHGYTEPLVENKYIRRLRKQYV